MNDPQQSHTTQTNSSVDEYQPPAQDAMVAQSAPAVVAPVDVASTVPSAATEEQLADQNIFFLLGIDQGTQAEKENFLDELQQIIWSDFVKNDAKLLVTDQEYDQFQQILAEGAEEPAVQEKAVIFMEKLIPDLEDIMLEKALDLKEDLVRERIASMRDFYSDDPAQVAKIDEAEAAVNANNWKTAGQLLNQVK